MEPTITAQFYEYDTPAWHDISKMIFMSTNLDSPSPAVLTRSYILPGVIPLATWYEDTSNVYRIFNEQIRSRESYYPAVDPATTASGFDIRSSIRFLVTSGDSIDDRLTVWDDVTHSSVNNYLISNDQVKISSVAYRYNGDEENPSSVDEIFAPQYNIALKGDASYYGDFNMSLGDILIFRLWLDGITTSTPYGEYEFVAVLHYSYT